jgi:hypothetical protein
VVPNRADRHIATVMAGIRNTHGAPPRQTDALLFKDVIVMLETLDCGLRDRAMLLLGFVGALRRSGISSGSTGDSEDGCG